MCTADKLQEGLGGRKGAGWKKREGVKGRIGGDKRDRRYTKWDSCAKSTSAKPRDAEQTNTQALFTIATSHSTTSHTYTHTLTRLLKPPTFTQSSSRYHIHPSLAATWISAQQKQQQTVSPCCHSSCEAKPVSVFFQQNIVAKLGIPIGCGDADRGVETRGGGGVVGKKSRCSVQAQALIRWTRGRGWGEAQCFFTCMKTERASCTLRDANCPHPTNGVHSSFGGPSSVGTVESESFIFGIWNLQGKKAKYNMHNIQHITETKASAERLSRPSRVPCQVEGPWEPLHNI